MKIALDATYSVGRNLSGVGVYSREILFGLAGSHPEIDWNFLYRPHRFGRALKESVPRNVRRGVLLDEMPWPRSGLFHGLNQRLPQRRFARQVGTFHDLFVMTGDYSTPEFRARFTEQARHAAAEADQIIAVSHFTAGQVVDLLGVDPGRITVIHHGVHMPAAMPAEREKIILHVGAVQKRKNLVRLVEAFGAVPGDWTLVLAGSMGFGAEEVLDAVEHSPARERIVLPGYVNDSDLKKWYARSSIFAFPSLDEGFGIPVLEAMAAGLAVVTNSGSSLGEVAGDAALLVPATDTEQLAEGLRRLCMDAELRKRMAQKGRERAGIFSWETAVGKTFEVLQPLI